MKLSEAIREGAKKRPQGFGAYDTWEGDVARSCALGAAYEGTFDDFASAVHVTPGLCATYPELASDDFPPVDGHAEYDLFDMIVYLNDNSRWTREQIADWLESIGY